MHYSRKRVTNSFISIKSYIINIGEKRYNMNKILIVITTILLLVSCGPKEEKKDEEKKLNYACSRVYTEMTSYVYSVEFDYDDNVIKITEEHYWELYGWQFNKKKYAQTMKNETNALNSVSGVEATYGISDNAFEYETKIIVDIRELDLDPFLKHLDFFSIPFLETIIEKAYNSGRSYHQERVRYDLIENGFTCE